jgi:sortase (surface protein transpeptidase)
MYWTIAVIALGAGALTWWWPTSSTQSPAVSVLSIAPRQTDGPVPRFPDIPTSRPVALEIPSLGAHTSVGELGLQPDGQVEVPTTTRVVGWYRYGVTPGKVGSAVILGHVDSYLGPGVFFNLKTLKAGDSLDLTLADGVRARFVVYEVVQYLKTAFPDRLVYGAHGASRSLQLVTCGGVFDRATGHYLSNVVVYSHLEGVSIPKAS